MCAAHELGFVTEGPNSQVHIRNIARMELKQQRAAREALSMPRQDTCMQATVLSPHEVRLKSEAAFRK